MPGILQGRHAGETGRGSATLVEIDLNGVRAREIALAAVAFETIDVDLAGAASLGERQELIGRALAAAARADHEIAARLRVTGAGSLAAKASLARQLAETACEEIDGVHIEAVRLVSSPERVAAGVVAELAALMKQDVDTPGFRDEALALIDEWQTAMPPEVAAALDPAELDAMIAEGLDAVVARLTIEGEP
jgi:exonuclease SbcD